MSETGRFRGVFAIPVTPFTDGGSLDEVSLARCAEFIVAAGGHGIVGPVNASETLATYMYRFGFVRFQLGYGSAVAIYMFLICLTFSLIYQRLSRQPDYLTGL